MPHDDASYYQWSHFTKKTTTHVMQNVNLMYHPLLCQRHEHYVQLIQHKVLSLLATTSNLWYTHGTQERLFNVPSKFLKQRNKMIEVHVKWGRPRLRDLNPPFALALPHANDI